MDIGVCRPGELTAADRAAWTALQAKAHLHGAPDLANPFLSPEFTLAMGRCRRGVRIAVIRERGEAAAFFPHQRTAAGVGRAVGLGVSDCQGLVHRPGFTFDAQELLRACGLAVWEFDHLATGQEPFEAHTTGSFPSPVMDVDDGYDAYLAGLRARSPKFTGVTDPAVPDAGGRLPVGRPSEEWGHSSGMRRVSGAATSPRTPPSRSVSRPPGR